MIPTECGDDIPTEFMNEVRGNDSLGFPPIDGGKPSHNLWERHRDWALYVDPPPHHPTPRQSVNQSKKTKQTTIVLVLYYIVR